MFRRVSIRLTLLWGDLITVLLALILASWLRPQLEFGKPLTPDVVRLAWPVYILALLIWGGGFLLTDVYNLQKNLRVADELPRLMMAHAATSLAFAGALYFSFREISRLQILSFAIIGLILLIIYRLLFRLMLHLFGDKRYSLIMTRLSVLLIGTSVMATATWMRPSCNRLRSI